jgi:hypothetical protein
VAITDKIILRCGGSSWLLLLKMVSLHVEEPQQEQQKVHGMETGVHTAINSCRPVESNQLEPKKRKELHFSEMREEEMQGVEQPSTVRAMVHEAEFSRELVVVNPDQ